MLAVDKVKLSKGNKIISFMNEVDILNKKIVVKASIYEDGQLVKEIKLKNFNKFADFIELAVIRGYQPEFIDINHFDGNELCLILEYIIRLNKEIEQSDELYPIQDINDLLYEQASFNNKLKDILS
mgnify:CR=1 FL=1